MKKINITVICVGDEAYPGCIDLLEDCPSINIVARPAGLTEAGAWVALGRSDVLLLDEALLEREGHDAVRAVHDSFPSLSSLIILENGTQQEDSVRKEIKDVNLVAGPKGCKEWCSQQTKDESRV